VPTIFEKYEQNKESEKSAPDKSDSVVDFTSWRKKSGKQHDRFQLVRLSGSNVVEKIAALHFFLNNKKNIFYCISNLSKWGIAQLVEKNIVKKQNLKYFDHCRGMLWWSDRWHILKVQIIKFDFGHFVKCTKGIFKYGVKNTRPFGVPRGIRGWKNRLRGG
jgi:hypothetical protein